MLILFIADRERGGYAEILRSLGWKSNYANDGHYDWWMKPDEFDIVSFKEAVNTLRSTPAPASPTHPSPHSSASHHSSVAGAPAQHSIFYFSRFLFPCFSPPPSFFFFLYFFYFFIIFWDERKEM